MNVNQPEPNPGLEGVFPLAPVWAYEDSGNVTRAGAKIHALGSGAVLGGATVAVVNTSNEASAAIAEDALVSARGDLTVHGYAEDNFRDVVKAGMDKATEGAAAAAVVEADALQPRERRHRRGRARRRRRRAWRAGRVDRPQPDHGRRHPEGAGRRAGVHGRAGAEITGSDPVLQSESQVDGYTDTLEWAGGQGGIAMGYMQSVIAPIFMWKYWLPDLVFTTTTQAVAGGDSAPLGVSSSSQRLFVTNEAEAWIAAGARVNTGADPLFPVSAIPSQARRGARALRHGVDRAVRHLLAEGRLEAAGAHRARHERQARGGRRQPGRAPAARRQRAHRRRRRRAGRARHHRPRDDHPVARRDRAAGRRRRSWSALPSPARSSTSRTSRLRTPRTRPSLTAGRDVSITALQRVRRGGDHRGAAEGRQRRGRSGLVDQLLRLDDAGVHRQRRRDAGPAEPVGRSRPNRPRPDRAGDVGRGAVELRHRRGQGRSRAPAWSWPAASRRTTSPISPRPTSTAPGASLVGRNLDVHAQTDVLRGRGGGRARVQRARKARAHAGRRVHDQRARAAIRRRASRARTSRRRGSRRGR